MEAFNKCQGIRDGVLELFFVRKLARQKKIVPAKSYFFDNLFVNHNHFRN